MAIQEFRRPEIEAGEKPAVELQPKPEQRRGGFRISFFFRLRIKATKPRKVRIKGGTHQVRALHALEAHEERALEPASSQDEKEESTWSFGGEAGVYCVTPPETGDPLG